MICLLNFNTFKQRLKCFHHRSKLSVPWAVGELSSEDLVFAIKQSENYLYLTGN